MRIDFLRFEGAKLRIVLAGLRTYLRPLVPGGDLRDLPDALAVATDREPPAGARIAVEVIEGRADAAGLLTAPEIANLIKERVPGVEVVSFVYATGEGASALRTFVGAVEAEAKAPVGLLVEPT